MMMKNCKILFTPSQKIKSLFLNAFVLLLLFFLLSACKASKVDLSGVAATSGTTTSAATNHQGITLSIIGGNFQTGAPSAIFADPLRVQLLDGNTPIAGATINFTISGGVSGTLTSASSVTDASGMTQTSFLAGATAGSSAIRASYNGTTVDFTETIINQNGTSIAIVSGNNQTANVGATLAQAFTIQVVSTATGLAAPGVLVRFSVSTGNGRINSASNSVNVPTDGAGIATVNFDVGTTSGVNTISATIVSVPAQSVVFSATGSVPSTSAISLSQSTVTSSVASLAADGSSTSTLTFTAKDMYANTIPTNTATVVFTKNAGTLLGSVTNHNNGIYTQILRSPTTTVINPIAVSAAVNTNALTSSAASISLIAGNISLNQSTITTGSDAIIADWSNSTLVTVTLKDALGNQLTTGGQTVTISTNLGTLIGSITDVGDGTYTQTLRAPTTSGVATISATVGASPLVSTGSMIFSPGAASIIRSSIVASPTSILPNGTSTSIITVILRDMYGNALTSSGGVATLATTSGTWSGAIVNNNDGTYQRTLVSPVSSGSTTISGTINTVALNSSARVYFTTGSSGPSVATSTVSITGGSSLVAADGSTTRTVHVILKNSTNQQLDAGGSNVVISVTAGTLIGSVTDNGNGTYDQLVRAPSSAAISTVSATVDSTAISNTTSISFYGAMSLTTSTVSAIPEAIEATGTTTSLLVIQAKDSLGTSIPVGGETGILFATTAGTLLSTIVDNNNGTYTQSLQSLSSTATATITATKSATPFSDTATVQFFVANNLAGITIDCGNISTYKNTNIVVDTGTLTMNSTGSAGTCPTDFVFTSITLRNSGIITHSATTSSQEYGLELSTGNLSIDATSSINVSGKGYPGQTTDGVFRVQGNQLVANKISTAATVAGGTYGGEGGGRDANQYSAKPYGSLYEPNELGSSGGGGPWGCNSSAGGGRLKITLTNSGTLSNNGSIKADGAAVNTWCAGSGSGGSIWINAGTLNGLGTITANGGSTGPAGGGGRIAIYYAATSDNFTTPANIVSNISAYGGVGDQGVYSDGAAGTIYLKSSNQTYGDLILNNGNRTNTQYAKTPLNVPATSAPDAMSAQSVTKAALFADTYVSTKSPYKGYYVNPNTTQNLTATQTDDVVFKITTATQNTLTISSGSLLSIANPATDQFHLALIFDNFEILGKASVNGNAPILALSGDLTSGNSTSAVMVGVCPSGLEFSGVTALSINSSGAYGTNTLATLNHSSAVITLSNGTFVIDSITANALTLDGGALTIGQLKGTNAIVLSGQLTMSNSASITQKATTTTNEYSLEIAAAGLTMNTGTTITAVGKGFLPTNSAGMFRSFGNADAPTLGGNGWSGGSHGGQGGSRDSANAFNATYGSITNPNESGSSGTGGNSGYAAAGGGIVRIDLSGGPAVINGIVDVTGAINYSGGAGGSIYLNSGALSGSGTLKANGGQGNYGGAGGGRIAIYYTSTTGGFAYPSTIVSRLQSFGGTADGSGSASDGAAGTIYLKSAAQTYGDLIINNNGNTNSIRSSTYINIPSAAASTGLSSTTLTRVGAFTEYSTYNTGHLNGFWLNPNTAQNGTTTLNDDTLFKINTQTTDALITSGDLTSIGASGNTFSVNLVLDNLELIGNARLETTGNILIKNGDLSSGNNALVMNGQLFGSGNAEFVNLTSATLDAQVASTGLIKMNNLTTSGNISMSRGTFQINQISASALSLDNAYLTAGMPKGTSTLALSGALTMTNAASITQRASTTTTEYSLEISSASLTMDTGTTITAVGKGFLPTNTAGMFRSFGNADAPTLGGSGWAGGSHGGQGGSRDSANGFNATYGSITNPYESGSSGNNTTNAAPGGGIVRIDLSGGSAVLDGIINVSGGSYYASGAGGSININAGAVSGGGTLKANGGGGGGGYGAGGGGRIALHYTSASDGFSYPSTIISRLQAYGGTADGSGSTTDGAAGTIYLKSAAQTYGDLIINNNGNTNSIRSSTYINIPTAAASTGLTSTQLTDSGKYFEGGVYNTNHLAGFWINPNTAQNATVTYNDDTVYKITGQTGNTLTASGGGLTSTGTSGNTYQVMLVLDNLELVGNARLESTGPILVKNGDLSSGTTNSATVAGQVLAGSSLEFAGLASASMNAQGQTMYLQPLTTTGALTLTNGTFVTSKVTAGSLTVSGSGNLSIGGTDLSPNVVVSGDVNITSSSSIKPRTPTSNTEYRLYITSDNIYIDGTSSINADGRGYQKVTSQRFRSLGNADYCNVTDCNIAAGGSYGGIGGYTAGHYSNSVYGSIKQPTDLGTSAGYDQFTGGGGAIRAVVNNTLMVDGVITANGNPAGEGASGGSVYITAPTLTGTGSIRANGGDGSRYGGGGGGRIAIYYTTLSSAFDYATIFNSVTTYGGANGSGYNGASGTIYLKSPSQTYGDLIVNNNSQTTPTNTLTVIPTTTSSASNVLTSTTLSTSAGFSNQYSSNNFLKGFFLNPNTSQNGTGTLTDDNIFEILSNTQNVLTTTSGLTGVGTSGDAYKLLLVFDNLEVRGKAKVYFPGQNIKVLSGDISSDDTTSFSLAGAITADTVDVDSATWSETANGNSTAVTKKCSINYPCP